MQAARKVRVAQNSETPVQVESNDAFTWRYAYARSAESRAVEDPGQDYLTLVSDNEMFAFALCDGVSDSFYGELSARLLGEGLVQWLLRALPGTLDPEEIGSSLAQFLTALTGMGTDLVRQQALPEDMAPMLRDVLEQKREIGSQSMFECGRIDMPSPERPSGRLVLAWLGDSRLRFWGSDGERTSEFGDTFKTEERWSTARGLVGGEPHVLAIPLLENGLPVVQRVTAYSDGLAVLNKIGQTPSSDALNDLIAQTNDDPTSDDIAFLEVWLTGLGS